MSTSEPAGSAKAAESESASQEEYETAPVTFFRLTPQRLTAVPDSRWVEWARFAALVVFPALVIFAIVQPAFAGRLFWTVAIASLPLFFVLAGYHRWRRICPLAFISQMPAFFGLAGQRRAGPWLRAHAYRLAFFVFAVSLWLRLVATNGDGYAIAAFLIGISVAALGIGLIFTGKTWCNYACPLFFIEKLYTEPGGLRPTPNSQCHVCTACRPACPDINEENSYWKEILAADKRLVFFAFPGIVLAFYGYYFVQAGTWAYYFGGRWTREVGLMHSAFRAGTNAATAGAYFWPDIPRSVAAAATLALGAAASTVIFSFAERPIGGFLRKRDARCDAATVRHVMFSLAAFTAFIAFYSYAGAPTLRLLPGAQHVFLLLVVTTAALFLVRRIGRRQRDFSEETLARRILAKWPWTDTPPPRDLHEAFMIHTVRSQPAEEVRTGMLDLYKDSVRESVNSGVVSRAEVHGLQSLRGHLRIAEADHERIMSELVEEDRSRGEGSPGRGSPEKQAQLEGYEAALAACFDIRAPETRAIDAPTLQRLRAAYAVTADEHRAALDHLVQRREGIAAYVLEAPIAIEDAAAAIREIEGWHSPVATFLARLLRRRWVRAVDGLIETVGAANNDIAALREDLLSTTWRRREAAVLQLASRLSPASATRLTDALKRSASEPAAQRDTATRLRTQLASPDPYVRATVFYLLQSQGAATDSDRQTLGKDEHPLVRDTVAHHQHVASGGAVAEPSTVEKMIALCSISLFEALDPEDLIQLAQSSTEAWFTQGDILCREGEIGDEAFVLLAGEISVFRSDGASDRLVGVEAAGTCIGELAVLDPAPRAATVVVSSAAARALRFSGKALRDARNASPAVSDGIIRLLAQRLRAVPIAAQGSLQEHRQR